MAALDIALELLETVLHSVLYLRNLYPEAIFRKRQKYKIPVQMSVHKDVNEYIAGALRSLRPYLEQRLLEEVAVLISDPAGRPYETLSVELHMLDSGAFTAPDDPYMVQLEASLAGLLLAMYGTLPSCPAPPVGSTFRLHATVGRCLPETLAPDGEFPLTVAECAAPSGRSATVLPVRSVRSRMLALQMTLRRPAG